MSKVSILVPVYNVEAYLEQCMDSLLGQTYKDIEIICLDDGSTDNSSAILDRYALEDTRVVVIHKRNTGYGNTLNVGLERATGEYIVIVESDDFADKNMIEKMYNVISNKEVDIVKAKHYDYRQGENFLCDLMEKIPKNEVINSKECPALLNLAHTIWSCIYRKGFLSENHIKFHETPGASYQDISFAIQCWVKAKRVYCIEDAFLHYRNDNPDSSMHNPNKIFCVFDEYEWLEKLLNKCWETNPDLEKFFVQQKYLDYVCHYNRIAMQYQYAFLIKLSEELKKDVANYRVIEEYYSPDFWTDIQNIQNDMNGYFLRTAKKLEDLRLKFCSFSNEDSYKKGFLKEISAYSKVYIYGAGRVGQRFADILIRNNIHIDAFIVTEKENNIQEYKNILVLEVQSRISEIRDAAVIIAVSERYQYELYDKLIHYKCEHIYRVDKLVNSIV